MNRINYHHLHYFWVVAQQGKLTQAAALLHVSQSALSIQVKQLEDSLGQTLFTRTGRQMELTEAGRIAYSYADDIFRKGDELRAVLEKKQTPDAQILRVGALATLSRNFQEEFLRPMLGDSNVRLVLITGRLEDLLDALAKHTLDLVLSNVPIQADEQRPWRCRLIARQQVSVVGKPRARRDKFTLPGGLLESPLIVPGVSSEVRPAFELLCEQWGIRPQLIAEVDDMPMLRLLARDTDAMAILPQVVVRDEINSGDLIEHARLPGIFENFYAISIRRHFEVPQVKQLLARRSDEMLPSPRK